MKHKEKQKHLEGRHFIKTARMSTGRCNIQEDTPQCQTSAEAPARNQAAGEIDFSKPFICVFSPPKHPCLDKDGPCNTQDKTPLHKSPLEAPACGQAEGKKSAFGGPINVICSPSKGRMEIHMLRNTRRDEDAKLNSGDALQRRHKAEAPNQDQKAQKASSSESFPSISSKDKQNDAGPCNTQDKTPLPMSPLEAPACGHAEGKKSAVGGPFNVICSPSKGRMEIHMLRKTPVDEDGKE
uniref:Uncharacterized protein n=1 Tax=Myotis myotis TaxID=51298 RepID=A0A7J7WHW1_MYOMY|nr:hypothetical protein mMyoMyo1_012141 [Myotis myotis]